MEGGRMRDKIAEIFYKYGEEYYRALINSSNPPLPNSLSYADQILALLPNEEDIANYGAKMMAKQIRKCIEQNSGVFGNKIDEDGNVIQSDANWILEQFRKMPSLEELVVEKKDFLNTMRCQGCKGEGTIPITEDVYHEKKCSVCDGTGMIGRGVSTHPAEWDDIEIRTVNPEDEILNDIIYLVSKTGRLRIKKEEK
jgi:hypothetical protein